MHTSQARECFSWQQKYQPSGMSSVYSKWNGKADLKRIYSHRSMQAYKCVIFLVLIASCSILVKGQGCTFPSGMVFSLKETDPAGTEIFNVSSNNRSYAYRYTTSDTWLTSFLDLSLNDTSLVYSMSLTQPLDLEEIYYNLSVTDLLTISFTLFCTPQAQPKKDFFIFVEAVNEWSPEFNMSSIELTVKETLPVNAVVINLTNWASDYDVSPFEREIAFYSILQHSGDPQISGSPWLRMSNTDDGIVIVSKQLNYDELPPDKKFLLLGVQVVDRGGQTGTASMTVNIEDDDTNPPVFTYLGCGSPCLVTYAVTVSPNFTGHVTAIKPASIQARDGDTLNYQIEFYIVQGPPNYEQSVRINNITGQLTILQELGASGLDGLVLIVEAREVSIKARTTRTTLLITVADGVSEEEAAISTNSGDDTIFIVVATILAVAVVAVLVVLIILTVYFKKRYKKTVHPENSLTALQVSGLEALNSQDEKTLSVTGLERLHSHNERTLSVSSLQGLQKPDKKTLLIGRGLEKMLAQRTGPETNLGSGEREDVYATPQRHIPDNERSQTFNVEGNVDQASADTRELVSSLNADHIRGDNENTAGRLGPAHNINTTLSSALPEKLSTNEHHINSSEKRTKQPAIPLRPSLKVLTGLKVLDNSESNDIHYDTVELISDDCSSSGEFPDADRVTMSSSFVDISNKESETNAHEAEKKHTETKTTSPAVDLNIYDGTKEIENVKFDSGFYTDSSKTRIARSSPLPATILDPNDTRYWITISDDY